MATRFDKEVSTLIAKPATKDGIPLYTRVDGKMDVEGNHDISVSNEYANRSKETYTSPDNIKRIFITKNGVHVHLHCPVPGTRQGSSLKRDYEYSAELKEIISKKEELYFNGIRYGYEQVQATGDKNLELNGYGLGALYRPHVYQNVEEIYVDWLPLTNCSLDRSRDFSYFYGATGGDLKKSLLYMFKESCGQGITSIADRYPRLQTIGFIENLEEMYSMCDNGKSSDTFERWKDYAVGSLLDDHGISYSICETRNNKDWIKEWSVKEGIYVFDRNILKPYADKIKMKYANAAKAESERKVESAKHPIEARLDALLNKEGQDFVIALLASMLINREISSETIKGFSEQGKSKYAVLANITI